MGFLVAVQTAHGGARSGASAALVTSEMRAWGEGVQRDVSLGALSRSENGATRPLPSELVN
eukprot:scaffold92636_cov32-Tisochrysis_lutea.AAC.1